MSARSPERSRSRGGGCCALWWHNKNAARSKRWSASLPWACRRIPARLSRRRMMRKCWTRARGCVW